MSIFCSVYKGKNIPTRCTDGLKDILVKHDIFLNDVNTCFLSLKKAVRDLHALSESASHLQMGQPIVRFVCRTWMSSCTYTLR
jgi:hypothetical protein